MTSSKLGFSHKELNTNTNNTEGPLHESGLSRGKRANTKKYNAARLTSTANS